MTTRHDPVRREATARGPRIVVPLGGADYVLTVERATELRDELSTALAGGSEPTPDTDDNPAGANCSLKATLVSRDGDRATVRLTPSWPARWFGARETVVELEWHEEGKRTRRFAGWLSLGSRRWLDEIDHHALIESALDFVPVAALPRAVARELLR